MLRDDLEIRDAAGQLMQEPNCPDCHIGVDRPKCLFELGGYCPRHPLLDEWRRSRWGQMSERRKKYHILTLYEDDTEPCNSDKFPPERREMIVRIYGGNARYQGA